MKNPEAGTIIVNILFEETKVSSLVLQIYKTPGGGEGQHTGKETDMATYRLGASTRGGERPFPRGKILLLAGNFAQI